MILRSVSFIIICEAPKLDRRLWAEA